MTPRAYTRRAACRLAPLALGAAVLAACGWGRGTIAGATITAPDFPIVAYQGAALLGGAETRFAAVFRQGEPVVLNFWAGQCPPCQAEMPSFQRVADDYQGRVLGVGVDVGRFTALGGQQSARQFLGDLRITYPAAYAVDQGDCISGPDSPQRGCHTRAWHLSDTVG
jgi:thiol-disulfide isomerase/thioredoxin